MHFVETLQDIVSHLGFTIPHILPKSEINPPWTMLVQSHSVCIFHAWNVVLQNIARGFTKPDENYNVLNEFNLKLIFIVNLSETIVS